MLLRQFFISVIICYLFTLIAVKRNFVPSTITRLFTEHVVNQAKGFNLSQLSSQ